MIIQESPASSQIHISSRCGVGSAADSTLAMGWVNVQPVSATGADQAPAGLPAPLTYSNYTMTQWHLTQAKHRGKMWCSKRLVWNVDFNWVKMHPFTGSPSPPVLIPVGEMTSWMANFQTRKWKAQCQSRSISGRPTGQRRSILILAWEYKVWLNVLHVNNWAVWFETLPLRKDLLTLDSSLFFLGLFVYTDAHRRLKRAGTTILLIWQGPVHVKWLFP